MHHFDKLSIEHYGRVWERIVIILNADKARDLTKCKRRKRWCRVSNFKFLVGNGQRIIVMVPIDFLDEEIVQEFERNLVDMFLALDEDDFNY